MKINAFVDILLNWYKMSDKQKTQRLQDLENMVARFQERKPRTIVTKVDNDFISQNIGVDRLPGAYYNRGKKDNIYIINLDSSSIEVIKNIIHEGFHAYVDDFISGRVKTLKLYSEINLEKFFIEEENLPAIFREFDQRNMMPLFDSFYIEERVNYQEDTIYIIKMILDAIETPLDAMYLTESFALALDYASENETRGKIYESRYGMSYDDIVISALNKECDEKIEISKDGKIVQLNEPELMRFFKKVIRYYDEYTSIRDSLFMTQEMKDIAQQKAIEKVALIYKNYVLNMLREKKKV